MTIPLSILTVIASVGLHQPLNSPLPDGRLRIVWDLHVSAQSGPVLDWLEARGWCWGIEIPPTTAAELAAPLRDRGFRVIGQIHGHPETRAWHWSRRGDEAPDIGKYIELLRALNREAPRVVFFMEDDSAGVGFSKRFLSHPPTSHEQAKAMFDAYLDEAMTEVRDFPDVEAWAMAGFAGTCHHYARRGAQCILVERANDDVEDLQTGVAFARGAARQFDCEWGIDLSLWWGVIYGCVQELPASLYTRHLWLSTISGAKAFRIEGGDLLVRPDGTATVVAEAIDAFARLARDVEFGSPAGPAAVLLPQDHGWMTPAYWRTANEAWNYARVPYRPGDRGVDGFFGAAFPGAVYAQDPFPMGAYEEDEPPASPFALSCITPEFAPLPEQARRAAPPLPFGTYVNRDQARDDFRGTMRDPSPYRPMGDSRWGDIFDVITDDLTLETLRSYRAVVLLGQVQLTEELKRKLLDYVNSGGVIVTAAGVVGPGDMDVSGVEIRPELRVGRSWQWEEEDPVHEAFRYCPVQWPPADAGSLETLAVAANGAPLVVRRVVGVGSVYTCLLPWFEAGHANLASLALRLLDAVLRPLQPVVVDGPPASWVSARGADSMHRSLAIANHDEHPWRGRVRMRCVDPSLHFRGDIVSGESLDALRDGEDSVVDLEIAPFSVRVLRWDGANSTTER